MKKYYLYNRKQKQKNNKMKRLKKYLVEKRGGYYHYYINGKSIIIQKTNKKTFKWEVIISKHSKDIDWWSGEILSEDIHMSFGSIKHSLLLF